MSRMTNLSGHSRSRAEHRRRLVPAAMASRVLRGPHVNSIDPGAPGTMLVAEHAGKLGVGENPGAPDAGVIWPALRASFSTAKASLGIGEDNGPRGSNWQVVTLPRFRWYFAGSVVSNFGTWLQNTAQVVLDVSAQSLGLLGGRGDLCPVHQPAAPRPVGRGGNSMVRELAHADRHPERVPADQRVARRTADVRRADQELADRRSGRHRACLHVRAARPVGHRRRPGPVDRDQESAGHGLGVLQPRPRPGPGAERGRLHERSVSAWPSR